MSWQKALKSYRDPAILRILFLGFSSGLPFLMTLATLHVWLLEVGISKTSIGLFAAVTLPYSLKFLWAPVVDRYPLPGFCTLFGQRKGWMIFSQLCLMITLILLGKTRPDLSPLSTAVMASCVAFFSATQDIVVEAFRIETLMPHTSGLGAGASSTGYRLGMWVSGAGALYLASFFSWSTVYTSMAVCLLVGLITTLLSHEPMPPLHQKGNVIPLERPTPAHQQDSGQPQEREEEKNSSVPQGLKALFQVPFQGLLKEKYIFSTLVFIFLFKVGDTVLNTMTMPFLLETGFSKIEIAHVAKSFGIACAVLGSLTGGLFLAKRRLIDNLVLSCAIQLVASLMFMIQARLGHHLPWLFISMGVENFACGMATAAYLVFLSSRCHPPFTGTHFALLCSFGSFCRVLVSSFSGWAADQVAWQDFYLMTGVLCLPALLFIGAVPQAFQRPNHKKTLEKKIAA